MHYVCMKKNSSIRPETYLLWEPPREWVLSFVKGKPFSMFTCKSREDRTCDTGVTNCLWSLIAAWTNLSIQFVSGELSSSPGMLHSADRESHLSEVVWILRDSCNNPARNSAATRHSLPRRLPSPFVHVDLLRDLYNWNLKGKKTKSKFCDVHVRTEKNWEWKKGPPLSKRWTVLRMFRILWIRPQNEGERMTDYFAFNASRTKLVNNTGFVCRQTLSFCNFVVTSQSAMNFIKKERNNPPGNDRNLLSSQRFISCTLYSTGHILDGVFTAVMRNCNQNTRCIWQSGGECILATTQGTSILNGNVKQLSGTCDGTQEQQPHSSGFLRQMEGKNAQIAAKCRLELKPHPPCLGSVWIHSWKRKGSFSNT